MSQNEIEQAIVHRQDEIHTYIKDLLQSNAPLDIDVVAVEIFRILNCKSAGFNRVDGDYEIIAQMIVSVVRKCWVLDLSQPLISVTCNGMLRIEVFYGIPLDTTTRKNDGGRSDADSKDYPLWLMWELQHGKYHVPTDDLYEDNLAIATVAPRYEESDTPVITALAVLAAVEKFSTWSKEYCGGYAICDLSRPHHRTLSYFENDGESGWGGRVRVSLMYSNALYK